MKMTSSLSAVFEETEIGDSVLEGRSIATDKVSLDLEPLIEKIFAFEDENEIDKIERPNHTLLWREIEEEFQTKRTATVEYKASKQFKPDVPPNPDVDYLHRTVFPLLLQTLHETLVKAKDLNILKHQKSRFNGVDYIAETLWNLNPQHPERHKKRVYIFDMQWVNDCLQRNPRPFYPFSYIWSRDFATTKIQAAMRGYWVRRTDAVQEMRQFWKALAMERELKAKSLENLNATPSN